MLRVTIELFPDSQKMNEKPKGIVLKYIDIKEDGTGTAFWGNYKSKFYTQLSAAKTRPWRQKQVSRMLYKDYYPELLLYLVLKNWIKDVNNGVASWENQHRQEKEPVDYPAWKLRRYGDLKHPKRQRATKEELEEFRRSRQNNQSN